MRLGQSLAEEELQEIAVVGIPKVAVEFRPALVLGESLLELGEGRDELRVARSRRNGGADAN